VTNQSSLMALLALILMIGGAASAQKNGHVQAVSANNEAEIKALYDRWVKAFEAGDIDGIMSVYAPGDAVVAYDVVPPLQYKGKDAYRKDYQQFLNQYDGPVHVEYRDMRIISSGDVGFIHALERFTGKLKNGLFRMGAHPFSFHGHLAQCRVHRGPAQT